MEKLNLEFLTVPGRESYTPESVPVNDFFFIVIIAEGKEESLYLDHIKTTINAKSESLKLKVEILNQHYKSEKQAISESHPLKRLDALKEWSKSVKKLSISDDEEWIVCDRDNGSFTGDQYDALLEDASGMGINVVVSNPAFQIWLLFHFTNDISSLKLDTFPHSKDRLKLVESELKKYVPEYKHGSLDVDVFSPHIKDAMKNSLNYPHDLESLKEKSGTNFKDLLKSIDEKASSELFK